MKTTTISSENGTTVIKTSHSFGCGWVVIAVLLAYSLSQLPILIVPTIVIVAAMVWAKVTREQHR